MINVSVSVEGTTVKEEYETFFEAAEACYWHGACDRRIVKITGHDGEKVDDFELVERYEKYLLGAMWNE